MFDPYTSTLGAEGAAIAVLAKAQAILAAHKVIRFISFLSLP
ncbi:Uncharacterised protein [Vibrio cholerae]|nr:Uncharacterised protein [Vibrio cholerae]CSI32043.1 Uncharacterised protein [Vibrio cholerae]